MKFAACTRARMWPFAPVSRPGDPGPLLRLKRTSRFANVRSRLMALSGHLGAHQRCPHYPRKRTWRGAKPLNVPTPLCDLALAIPPRFCLIISGPDYLAVGHDRVRDLSSVLIISGSRNTRVESVVGRLIYLGIDLHR